MPCGKSKYFLILIPKCFVVLKCYFTRRHPHGIQLVLALVFDFTLALLSKPLVFYSKYNLFKFYVIINISLGFLSDQLNRSGVLAGIAFLNMNRFCILICNTKPELNKCKRRGGLIVLQKQIVIPGSFKVPKYVKYILARCHLRLIDALSFLL